MTGSAEPTMRTLKAVAAVAARCDEDARELAARVAWNTITEPGDRVAGALVAQHGPRGALEQLRTGAGTADTRELADARTRWLPRLRDGAVDRALELARHAGLRLLTPDDPQWPRTLDDLGDHAPLVLWARGDAQALTAAHQGVSLVGARAASGYGEHVAGELASELGAHGVSIVSGAAFGIDAAAHRATLGVGGTTVAFLAGGADRAYPHAHASLLGQIAASGVVVSEVPPGAAPTKWRFLQRNRLIAALTGATVVVEAGWRSGSLNTAHHASALGRPLGAVPGPITSAASAGCHRLLRDLDAVCITSAADVQELLGVTQRDEPAVGSRLTSDQVRVLDALSTRTSRTVDDIATRAGLAVAPVRAALGTLALSGAVRQDLLGWRAAPHSQ